jgi:RHS repeat-associated protein
MPVVPSNYSPPSGGLFPSNMPAAGGKSDGDPNGKRRGNSQSCMDCSLAKESATQCNSSYSLFPVRYSNGEIYLVEQDLGSEGFGVEWGHTRSYSNRVSPTNEGFNGNSWFVKEVPYLVRIGTAPDYLVVVGTINDAVWFEPNGSGGWRPRDYAKETLVADAANKEYVLRDDGGQEMRFYDFDAANPAIRRGAFKSFKDAAGRSVTVSFGTNDLISEFNQVVGAKNSGYSYTYYTSGDPINRLRWVTLRVDSDKVRQAEYDYYDGIDSYGSSGDLRRVKIQEWDGSVWVTVATHYYRYYKSGDTDGVVNGLKYVVSPLGYAAMVAAGITPETATNAQIAQYAIHFFQYNTDRSVKLEVVNGGTQSFGFSITANTTSTDPNVWQWRTVSTLPDGNQQVVYTNLFGLVILKVLEKMSGGSPTGERWYEYSQYDSKGRITLEASSAAINSYSWTAGTNVLTLTLKPSDGLIRLYEYYGTTPPSGGVEGYIRYEKVQQGTSGTPITISEWQYTTRTVSSVTRVVPYRVIEYQSAGSGGSDPATTEYSYTWQGTAFQVDVLTTTLPVIPTSQNGSGTANTWQEKFDAYGNVTWKLDERGYIYGYTYDISTGGLTKLVEDASSGTPWTPAPGAHLDLTTDYTVDAQGRATQALGPVHTVDIGGTATSIRRATWTVYKDDVFESWVGQGYQKTSDSSFTLINPVSVTRRDVAGRVTDRISATRASTSGKLLPTDSLPQTGWMGWSKSIYTDSPSVGSERVYFLIPSTGEGTSGTNYNLTQYGYDNMRRVIRVVSPDLTISRVVLNTPGWVAEQWLGTNDTGATASNPGGAGGANNMVKVVANQYDGNAAGGNGTLTKETRWEDASNTRVTDYTYDWRGRRTVVNPGLGYYEQTSYDNVDRPKIVDRKDGTAVIVTRNETKYDYLGRVYQQLAYTIASGIPGDSLKEKSWYDPSGRRMKKVAEGSRQFTKTQYDQVGRPTKLFKCFNTSEADTNYPAAATVTTGTGIPGNAVQEQTENTYDNGGNVIQVVTRKRFHDATTTALGELTTPGGSQPKARAEYRALYPDSVGRIQANANYGTNAAASFTRSSTVPSRSDTVLVVTTEFDSAGRVWKVIDPRSIENRTEYDNAGRITKTIENYVSGGTNPDQNKTTEMAYTADNQLRTLTAKNSVTGDQVTTWVYGTTLTDSDVARNDLLRAKEFPDKATSTDRVEYKYNRVGEIKEIKDQAGTIRTLNYDAVGRLLHDRVTTLATGVDGAVRRISRSYEIRGMLEKLTSWDNATVGTGSVVNEVQNAYNGFGQLSIQYQALTGAVSTGTSPKVQYGYSGSSSNYSRRASVTYPAGTVIDTNYGTTDEVDDVLNRVKQFKNSTTVLVDYNYLGQQTAVIAGYTGEPGVELTYYTSGGSGDAGDQYTGLDRFGRIIDQRWRKTSDNSDKERVKYGYDRASNRVWRQNTVAGTGQDEFYSYDGLSQVKTLDRGTLNGTYTGITGTPSWEEDWTYDPTGNWNGTSTGYLTKAAGTTQLNQNRTHNVVNEMTDITETTGTAWPTPTFDAAGNMTVSPRPLSLGNSYDLKYDAWNRLIEVKNTGGATVATYRYDGATRRVSKYDGTDTRYYYYSDQWQVLEERLNASTSADRWYVWGVRSIDDLVLRHRSSERLYALNDAMTSVTAVVSTAGAVQERYGYDGFGAVRFMTSSFGTSTSSYAWETLFDGYRYDSDTGFYQVRYRYLHPQLGRWISRDPIEEMGGFNLYEYVSNSPIDKGDSDGRGYLNTVPPSMPYNPPAPPPTLPPYPGGGNCYNYACNRPPTGRYNDKPIDDGILYPGQRGGLADLTASSGWTCKSVRDGVRADYPGDANIDVPRGEKCTSGYHKIRPEVTANGQGFHFKRQNPDGSWSEQLGNNERPAICNPNSIGYPPKPGERPDKQCPDICVPD